MDYLVLGALEVLDAERPVPLGSAKQRLLLTALLVHANAVVSVDQLGDVLWGDAPPADSVAALQTYVSRLRGALEPDRAAGDVAGSVLLTRAPGYVLRVEPDQLDAAQFERLVVEGQQLAAGGDAAAASSRLDEALALWRGRAYAEFADDEVARTESLRLEELRRVALDERVEANLSLGRHAEVIGELEAIVQHDPLRERARGQLMLALYRSGRQAEALRTYQDHRRYLGDELGVEPARALQTLEQDIVQRAPHLTWAPTEPIASSPRGSPSPAPHDTAAAAPVAPGFREPVRPTAPDRRAETRDLAGRFRELDQLRAWLSEALGGSPRIVVVSGATGVGKSRLVEALIADAREANVRSFAGRCIEGSDVPLLPLASVLDALGRSHTPADLASTFDEHGARMSAVFDAGRALTVAAAERPVLLAIEDVQWSDAATVEFLAHLSATLAHEAVLRELPLMLLVTTQPGVGSPGARRLVVRLGQERSARSMHVPPLDELGVFEMLAERIGTRPSMSLLRLVRDATAGNPMEIDLMIARLERAGVLELRDGEMHTTVREMSALRAEMDVVLDDRIGNLSEPAAELLTIAALLRDPTIASVRIASGLDDDEFEHALDDVVESDLLTEDGVRIDFVDPAVRRARVRALTGRRRRRIHGDIARRLVEAETTSPISSTEIAEQLIGAGADADSNAVATRAQEAGDEALALGAWTDAVRYYDVALTGDGGDGDHGALEHAAGIAAYRSGDPRAAAAHADRAIEIARDHGDVSAWGEAALLRSRAAFVSGAGSDPRGDARSLEEFLDAAGAAVPALRARAHATLSEIATTRRRSDAARAHAAEAEELAGHVDDPSTIARVEFAIGLERFASLELDAAIDHFRRCEERARDARDTLIEAWALGRQAMVLMALGRFDEADAGAARAARHAREHGWWGEYSWAAALQTGIAVARGHVGAAEALLSDAASAQRRGEAAGAASLLWSAVASARVLVGDGLGAHRALDEWEREDPRSVARCRELVDALGAPDDRRGRHGEPVALAASGAPIDLTMVAIAATDVELADALDRPEIAAHALPLLNAGYDAGLRFTPGWPLLVPRLAAVACMLTGAHDDAELWLQRAAAAAQEANALGEQARVAYDSARVHSAVGDTAGAVTPLEASIDALERLGYRRLHAAARRLAGRPETPETPGSSATRVILVTDLVDSTPLNQRLGDRRFVELLREHNRIVRGRLRQQDGVEFKHTGDGIAAWFLTAGAAVRCALDVQEDLDRHNQSSTEPLHVRIGLAAGEVISNEGDLFGLAVIEAFRVSDHATEGRILVSEAVPALVRDASIEFRTVGQVGLKGFADTRALYEVVDTSPTRLRT